MQCTVCCHPCLLIAFAIGTVIEKYYVFGSIYVVELKMCEGIAVHTIMKLGKHEN